VNRVDGDIVEAYPAAAFRAWGVRCAGYKGNKPEQVARRQQVAADLLAKAPWLELSQDARAHCEASDHHLDALVCALIARAASVGLTILPNPEQRAPAQREGWIHLPLPNSLGRLAGERGDHRSQRRF
jgi:predicted RNase H-like nuclease